eukprot:CAMPEP_0202850548 /NCGR_PEP_ID=MMETSP1389-20130828/83979_1 /ASSEMBLY_ACC=CAM_ASM_000865 /TAXON_ID=302021 /ORGANISM="Rhodomonas sp., Strain CCMP768" /LENGTH=33 /DNA_ID= /DNA_START= /DNA_END= /DNA_ORIENTATION=
MTPSGSSMIASQSKEDGKHDTNVRGVAQSLPTP